MFSILKILCLGILIFCFIFRDLTKFDLGNGIEGHLYRGKYKVKFNSKIGTESVSMTDYMGSVFYLLILIGFVPCLIFLFSSTSGKFHWSSIIEVVIWAIFLILDLSIISDFGYKTTQRQIVDRGTNLFFWFPIWVIIIAFANVAFWSIILCTRECHGRKASKSTDSESKDAKLTDPKSTNAKSTDKQKNYPLDHFRDWFAPPEKNEQNSNLSKQTPIHQTLSTDV